MSTSFLGDLASGALAAQGALDVLAKHPERRDVLLSAVPLNASRNWLSAYLREIEKRLA